MSLDRFNDKDRDLLIRLDERLDNLERSVSDNKEIAESVKKELIISIDKIKDELKLSYVSRLEFTPVQRAVYSAIGFILTAFLGALVTLLLKTH